MTRRACLALALAACGSTPAAPPAPPVAAPTVDTTDRVPFSPDDRAAELAFLRDAIRDTYAHLEVKQQQWGVDLDALFAHYEPRIRAADTWTHYEAAMVGFVSALHDAHVAWRRKRATTEARRRVVRLGLDTRLAAGELIVSNVWKGSSAEAAGLAVGDRIVAIDSDPVDKRMAILAAVRSASRVEAAAYDFAEQWPASRIAADAAPRARQITRERDGAVATVRVVPETTGRPSTRVRLSQRAREAHRAWKGLAEDPDRKGWSVAQPLTVHGAAAGPYPANIAAVIDAGCRSSCETLALLLHEAGGRLIGERTGGASGAPVTVVLPMSKATVTIPARAMYDPHGGPIEGHGVSPDDEVSDDRAAIASGHDRAFDAAVAWACQRQPAPCP